MTWKWVTNIIDSMKAFSKMSPAFVDGFLYVMMGVTGFSVMYLGTDDASKYMAPEVQFWTLFVIGIIDSALLGLKMFRSTGFADHKAEMKEKEDTKIFKQTDKI